MTRFVAPALALVLILPLLLAGCAGGAPESSVSEQDVPIPDTGAIIGEVGDPRSRAKLHTELAAQYYSRGTMSVALQELRTAVTADSNFAPAYGLFGLVYMDLRENRLAEDNFERALRLSPNDPDLNHNYGWFLCQTEREPASIKYFLQAIRNPLYPTPWRSYSAAGQCSLKVNNLKDAEEFSQRALRLDPDDPPSVLQMAQVRYKQGRMGEARNQVERYNKLVSPTSESLWLALRIERNLGGRVAAQQYANQLRRRFPGSPEYQFLQRGKFD